MRHPVDNLSPEQRDAVQWLALQNATRFAENHAQKGNPWNMERRAIEIENQEYEIMSTRANIEEALRAYRGSNGYDASRYLGRNR